MHLKKCQQVTLGALPWWRYQIETFSALLAICEGNSPVTGEFPHKGQWRGSLTFSLICAWINGWANNRDAGDLRRDVTAMTHRLPGPGRYSWMRTDVPQSLSSTIPLFTSPYVSRSRCSPTLYSVVPFSPHEVRPMFPSLCVSQSLCFPVPMFSSLFIPHSRYSP